MWELMPVTIKTLRFTGCCPSDLNIYSARGTLPFHFVEQSVQAIGATVTSEMLKNKEIVVGTTEAKVKNKINDLCTLAGY
jgi:hypothetical protein